jgi:hypothetical protein
MKKDWINKIVVVNKMKYIVSSEQISIGDTITNGLIVRSYDDTHSLLGWNKIVATEENLGFIKLESKNRLFEEHQEIEIDYVPITKRWIDAIINRGGNCHIEDIRNDKLVISF